MAVEMTVLAQEEVRVSTEFAVVEEIAHRLLDHLCTPAAQSLIAQANRPNASSALVQATFLPFALELGFEDERKGLFASYPNAALRPDYYKPVGDTGILMEVERGKTLINNMDILDFWKCHLCNAANYLFLLVPLALRQNEIDRPTNTYRAVVSRLEKFFVRRNYTNVRAAFIFGY